MVTDGCVISPGAKIVHSILGPGVFVGEDAFIADSIVLTDSVIGQKSQLNRAILDKRITLGAGCIVGKQDHNKISMIGKNSIVPAGTVIQPGGMIGPDVIETDYTEFIIGSNQTLLTRRSSHEI
jgi:glucose-1-phosphate adenylyltransferase